MENNQKFIFETEKAFDRMFEEAQKQIQQDNFDIMVFDFVLVD